MQSFGGIWVGGEGDDGVACRVAGVGGKKDWVEYLDYRALEMEGWNWIGNI